MSLNWGVPCSEGLSWYLPSLVLAGAASFGLPSCLQCDDSRHGLLLDFSLSFWNLAMMN